MSNKITGFGPTKTVVTGGSRPGAVERPAGESPASGGATPAGDSVTLTDSARTLQKLSEAVAATPVVNGAKVEAVKSQLASNTYKVDSLKVAAKLLLADRDLPNS